MREDLQGKVIQKTFLKDGSPGLPLCEFKIKVLVVPPNHEIELGISKVHYEYKNIRGYSLNDAKRKAGIK